MSTEKKDDTPTSVSGPMLNQDRVFVPSSIGKLAGVDPQTILDRVAAGELLRQIAADYDCSQPAVSYFIQRHVSAQEWQTVRQMSIAARLERSTDEMESAADPLMLARARESARLWMWRAEREHPHLYGQRQELTHVHRKSYADALRDLDVVSEQHSALQQSADSDE